MVAGLGIAGATPASGADVGAFNGCVDGTVAWTVGDTAVLVYDDAECTLFTTQWSGYIGYSSDYIDGDLCWTFTWLDGSGTGLIEGTSGGRVAFTGSGTTTAVPAVCGDPGAAAAPPIPAWVQAYARAGADAPCIEGWDPSWDLWPNDGTGGFVCQRSIPSLG